jgi:hypothetical protein
MRAETSHIDRWVHLLHGRSAGMLHVCSTGDWTGVRTPVADPSRAIEYAAARDVQGASGIYLRVTTLKEDAPSDHGRRASVEHSRSLPGLWADIDIAGPGHKHQPNHPGLPGYDASRPLLHPLPADAEQARAIVTGSGLPEPTLWVHSGGGLYPWWLLEEPEDLASDPSALKIAAVLSEHWQRALMSSAERAGTSYGNVGDLTRVMRIPGTVNRKVGEQPCVVLSDGGPRYTFDSLVKAAELAWAPPPVVAPRLHAAPSRPVATAVPQVTGSASPLDAFEAATPWEDILGPAGWRVHHVTGNVTHWTRPGKEVRDGSSATTGHADDRDRMWVFSSSAGLPTDEPLTKPFVWGIVNGHRGMAATAKALVSAGFGAPACPPGPFGGVTRLSPGTAAPVLPWPASNPPPLVPVADAAAAAPAPTVEVFWPPDPAYPGDYSAKVVEPVEFPVEALPAVVSDLVQQVSGELQVDPAMPAMFALAALSSLAAPRVQVFRSGRWSEALSLYTLVVGESGERKSPTARAVYGPLRQIERRMAAAHGEEVDRLIDEQDQARALARNNPSLANRIEEKIAKLEASKRRPPRIRLSNDVTPEALTRALGASGGSGAILDAEGTFFGVLCGRYTNGGVANVDLILNAYDGDEYSADRISREPDRVERPSLALGLAVQPVVLQDAMAARQLLERGVFARMMFATLESRIGSRMESTAAPHNPNPARLWGMVLSGIAELPRPGPGDEIPSLCCSPQALALHVQLSDGTEARLGRGGDLLAPGLREWAHKHAGRVLRIAGLLHLASGETISTEITEETMMNAIRIGDWSVSQARTVHCLSHESADEATVQACRQVLAWIERKRMRSFTCREACRGVHAKWVRTKAMEDALDQLCELGWLQQEPFQDRGGRWRQRYAVTPHIDRAAAGATLAANPS